MAFRRTPLLGSHVLLLIHIRGVLPNWQCLGRSRPQPTWTCAKRRSHDCRTSNASRPEMLRAIKHDRSPLGEIKLSWRVSMLGLFRSYFRFPPDRMRKAGERSVFIRSERAKGSHVGMSFSRRHAAECRKSEGRWLAWRLI